jgi:hypothetical protein
MDGRGIVRLADPNAMKATSSRVVVEVLSPTTRDFDTIGIHRSFSTFSQEGRVPL